MTVVPLSGSESIDLAARRLGDAVDGCEPEAGSLPLLGGEERLEGLAFTSSVIPVPVSATDSRTKRPVGEVAAGPAAPSSTCSVTARS